MAEKLLNGDKVPLTSRALYFVGRVLVYGPLMNALGFSRVRVALTAGEAIGGELFSFYRSLGLNLKQFYGQTEAFLCLTAQGGRRGLSRYRWSRDAQCRPAHRR